MQVHGRTCGRLHLDQGRERPEAGPPLVHLATRVRRCVGSRLRQPTIAGDGFDWELMQASETREAYETALRAKYGRVYQ